MNRLGTTLTEVAIYLALCAILSTVFMRFVVRSTIHAHSMTKNADLIAALYVAFDLLAGDVVQAPCDSRVWTIDDNAQSIRWEGTDVRITWRIRDKMLQRIVRRYDTKKQAWRRAVTQTVLRNVETFKYDVERYEIENYACIRGLSIHISIKLSNNKQYTTSRYVRLAQRMWYAI